ncbi:MAG: rhodanese-like domain-containing protein, partial [Desulfobulbaceae bacterium]|nr:rhodanese-like domain-containing protein [Desulfobulbaceae bacterium]
GYKVKRAPFDLFENVLVKEDFLKTAHGKIACFKCHKGDPLADTPEAAHQGMITDPTLTMSTEVCGSCHQEITQTASQSLHASPNASLAALRARCSEEQWQTLNKEAIGQQCSVCHAASCGSCHVSRPRVNGGGLMAGHIFKKRPDFTYQCAACHAQPVVDDFTGKQSRGDIHYLKGKVCVDCHGSKEVHAAAVKITNRYALPERTRCTDCHSNLAQSVTCKNELHKGTVDCAVCHSQAYENCTSCHMGVDQDKLAYSQSGNKYNGFKIGLNSSQNKDQPRFVLVRQIPIQADSFSHYLKENLKNYQQGETFKRSAVHNTQRQTWQNAHCNHCHGQKNLFLTEQDVPETDRIANQKVMVPETLIPKAIDALKPLIITGPKRNESIRVNAQWLNAKVKDKNVLILDVRTQKQFEEGHIPGARNLCECYLTTDLKTPHPYMMKTPEELAKVFSQKIGLTPDTRVVIYDDGKNKTGVTFVALERIGHKQVSFLDGNITAWTAAGYTLEQGKTPEVADSGYTAHPREVLVNSQHVKDNKDKGGMVLLDARNVSEYMGHSSRTDVTKKPGSIPGAMSLPLKSLLDSQGKLKNADELNWLFAQYGIAPGMEKTIVTSCNTKSLASELYLA